MTAPLRDEVMMQFPGSVTLRIPRLRSGLVLTGSLLLLVVAIGILMQVRFGIEELVVCVIGIPAVSYLAIQALFDLIGDGGRLVLKRDGFETWSIGMRTFFRWREVEAFKVQHYMWSPAKVVFDCPRREVPFLSVAHPGRSTRTAFLRSTFGMPVEDLARLMNEWRERALAESAAKARQAG